ncbi:MAG: NAD(P)-dependent oxidoreductase, partial [Selenomonas sp.]
MMRYLFQVFAMCAPFSFDVLATETMPGCATQAEKSIFFKMGARKGTACFCALTELPLRGTITTSNDCNIESRSHFAEEGRRTMKYAMNLEMKGRHCVVLGGGPVALRKVRRLV